MSPSTARREVFLACDFYGVDLKNAVKAHLERDPAFEVTDFGTAPYFECAASVARAVAPRREKRAVGVLVCGTGMGVGITANKHPGIRAATCESPRVARCARAINDANVLCLGQFFTSAEEAVGIVDAFMRHGFTEKPHQGDRCSVPWSEEIVSALKDCEKGVQSVERSVIDGSAEHT